MFIKEPKTGIDLYNLILTTLIIITSITAIVFNINKIYYVHDTVKGAILNLFNTNPGNKIKIVYPGKNINYYNPYKNIEPNIFNIGKFLVYKNYEHSSLKKIAYNTIKYTDYYKISDFITEMKKLNGFRNKKIPPKKLVLIPNPLPALIVDKRNHKKNKILNTFSSFGS